MTRTQFAKAAKKLEGFGWQTKIAKRLKVSVSTVCRWVSGESKVPGPVEAALECWLKDS